MKTRQLFIQDPDSERIRLTRAGLDRFAKRFAKVGVDARTIRTMAAFEAAVDASYAKELGSLASTAKGADPALDQAMQGLPGWD